MPCVCGVCGGCVCTPGVYVEWVCRPCGVCVYVCKPCLVVRARCVCVEGGVHTCGVLVCVVWCVQAVCVWGAPAVWDVCGGGCAGRVWCVCVCLGGVCVCTL